MVEGAARGGDRRARRSQRGLLDVARARPAGFHDRSAPGRRRRAVWRRAGDGDEAGAAVRGGRAHPRASAATPERDRADVARRRALHARRRGAVERARARRAAVRPLRRGRRARAASIWRPKSCRSATTCCRAASCRRWSSWMRSPGWCRAWSATRSRWRGIRSSRGLLDFPQYTRPAEFQGHEVPEVLLSGHHAEIARWRRREALARTLARRPDLLDAAALDDDDQALLDEIRGRGSWRRSVRSG